jgi:hypothetical protein
MGSDQLSNVDSCLPLDSYDVFLLTTFEMTWNENTVKSSPSMTEMPSLCFFEFLLCVTQTVLTLGTAFGFTLNFWFYVLLVLTSNAELSFYIFIFYPQEKLWGKYFWLFKFRMRATNTSHHSWMTSYPCKMFPSSHLLKGKAPPDTSFQHFLIFSHIVS